MDLMDILTLATAYLFMGFTCLLWYLYSGKRIKVDKLKERLRQLEGFEYPANEKNKEGKCDYKRNTSK